MRERKTAAARSAGLVGRLCSRCGAFVEPGAECCVVAGRAGATSRREAMRAVYASMRWRGERGLRLRVLRRDDWRCGECGTRDVSGRRLVAQHVLPPAGVDDELAWDASNVVTRCRVCAGREDAPRASADRASVKRRRRRAR